MAGQVEVVAAFGEDPFAAGENFAESKEISGNILSAFREAFFCDGKLVHQGEAKVRFFGAEVNGMEATGILLDGFPTDLAPKTGLVASSLDVGHMAQKAEENRFEKIPVFGAGAEQ